MAIIFSSVLLFTQTRRQCVVTFYCLPHQRFAVSHREKLTSLVLVQPFEMLLLTTPSNPSIFTDPFSFCSSQHQILLSNIFAASQLQPDGDALRVGTSMGTFLYPLQIA